MMTSSIPLMVMIMTTVTAQPTEPPPGRDITEIVGHWAYDGFFYEGQRYPKPNPDLNLIFTFNRDGSHRLFWERRNEGVFCERKGEYVLANAHLTQRVTWVNPENHFSCAQDPDMHMGREVTNKIDVRTSPSGQKELGIHLDLDGKPFIYILVRVPSLSAAWNFTRLHW
ncbi:hypothetical protein [Nocardioides sp.]|uniref:hypothetical protein n=1 Tax=Nocardioides sp. TaxID=35761 RepID=UPI003D102835